MYLKEIITSSNLIPVYIIEIMGSTYIIKLIAHDRHPYERPLFSDGDIEFSSVLSIQLTCQ